MKRFLSTPTFWLVTGAVLASGALLSALDSGGKRANWLRGWLAYSVLLGLGTASLALRLAHHLP